MSDCRSRSKSGVWSVLVALLWLGVASSAFAQKPPECEPPDVLLVVDFSGSMTLGLDGKQGTRPTKVDVLRQAYKDILTRFDKQIRFGLITFTTNTSTGSTCGTQSPDIRLHVPIGPNTASRCITAMNGMRANGCTPMLPALQGALNHYKNTTIPKDTVSNRRRFVVLLTDGVPNTGCPGYRDQSDSRACGRYLVQEVLKLRNLQVSGKSHDIKTYVIGFGKVKQFNGNISMDTQNLNDMAQAGGTGKYYQADDVTQLRKALETVANNAGGKVEVCNNKDDNCDGQVDENLIKTCQGACGSGKQVCLKGKWSACSAPPTKGKEVCNNLDDDCNGTIDDGLERDCPVSSNCGTQRKSRCVKGQWVGCSGQSDPPEICDGKDNDCDGNIDEGLSRPCKTACGEGIQACVQGDWSTCTAAQPSPEICNGLDDDCDGRIDDNASCNGKCVGGVCHKECRDGECPSGQECGGDGLCVEKGCEPVCSTDKVCLRGYCVPKDCSKPGGACRGYEVCRDGACVRNGCVGISCAAGQFCRVGADGKGRCHLSCAKVACEPSQRCEDGKCVADPCAGKACPAGQSCLAGRCLGSSGCPQKACSDTQACVNGVCTNDMCAGVTCPGAGSECRNGQCFGSDGPLVRDPKTGVVYPKDKPKGPGEDGDSEGGGGDGGSISDYTGPKGTCQMCSASGIPTHAPVFLLCLLLFLPWLVRRSSNT